MNKKCNDLEKTLAAVPDHEILNKIVHLKHNIEELDAENGIIVRARLRWSEKGKKSNKYFLGLEKRNGRKKQCTKLVLDDDLEVHVTNPTDILNLQCSYYEDIYESKLDVNLNNDVFAR